MDWNEVDESDPRFDAPTGTRYFKDPRPGGRVNLYKIVDDTIGFAWTGEEWRRMQDVVADCLGFGGNASTEEVSKAEAMKLTGGEE